MKNTVSRVNQVPGYRCEGKFDPIVLEHGIQQEVGDELDSKNTCLEAGLKVSYTKIFRRFGKRKPINNAKIEWLMLGTTWKSQAMRKNDFRPHHFNPIYHGFESFRLLQFFWESKFQTCFKKLISSRRFLPCWRLLVAVSIDMLKKCTRSTVIMSIVQMITTNEQYFRKSAYL